jgi:phospholipase/carboxylesterase
MDSLKTYTFGPASGGKPKQIVMLLHGLGADGRDLIGLAPMLAAAAPDAIFVSPDAPFPCDMAPMGRQWFSLQEWTPESILRGVQQAAPILDSFISEQLEKYGIAAENLALCGFSQGTMMSLYVGPRFPEKIAGVLGYSGALVWEQDADGAALQKIPVCLVHGNADPVVPVFAYFHAKETLEKAGFTVEGGVSVGLMHAIDPRGIETGKTFLRKIFKA